MAEDFTKLRRLALKVGGIPGVLAVILFGSHARGEQHEGSDIDLLVVFKNDDALTKGRAQVAQIAARSGLFLQVLCLTTTELEKSPLLPTILREGGILDQRASFSLETMATKRLRPYVLLTYDLRSLAPRDKVKFIHAVQGRGKGRHRYPGLLDHAAGYKVGRNTLMIPFNHTQKIHRFLEQVEAPYTTRDVWMMEPDP